MTIEDMEKQEKEHKERLANFTLAWEKEQAIRQKDQEIFNAAIQEDIKKSTNLRQELTIDINKLIAQKNELQNNCANLKAEKIQYEKELEVVISLYDSEVRLIEKLKVAKQDLINNIAQVEQASRNSRGEQEALLASLSKQIEAKKESLKTYDNTLAFLQKELVNTQEQCDILSQTQADLKVFVERKKGTLSQLDEDIRNLKTVFEVDKLRYQESLQGLLNSIDAKKVELEKNKKEFVDLTAMRTRLDADDIDLRFREEQLKKESRRLKDLDIKVTSMIQEAKQNG